MMKISEAAQKAGLSVKTARYYADINLVAPSGRTNAGYRHYDDQAVQRLTLVRRSRSLGFSLEQCRELLALFDDDQRTSAEVKSIATSRLDEIKALQRELELLHGQLEGLIQNCSGDQTSDCPIIDYLS